MRPRIPLQKSKASPQPLNDPQEREKGFDSSIGELHSASPFFSHARSPSATGFETYTMPFVTHLVLSPSKIDTSHRGRVSPFFSETPTPE